MRFNINSDPVTGITIQGELEGTLLYIHLSEPVKKMSVYDYKDFLMIFKRTKELVRGMGFKIMYCLVPDDLVKFCSMFGFIPELVFKDNRGKEFIRMFQEL